MVAELHLWVGNYKQPLAAKQIVLSLLGDDLFGRQFCDFLKLCKL